MIKNKKGIQLNQAFGAVLAVVLVAVLVIVAIFLFVSLNASWVDLDNGVNFAETMTAVNESGATSANATLCNFGTYVVTNASAANGSAIETYWYTSDSAGTISFAGLNDSQVINNTAWSTASTYNWGGATCDATDDMITQFATYPVLVGLVGTIIFLGIVIGVLVASFVFGRRGRV